MDQVLSLMQNIIRYSSVINYSIKSKTNRSDPTLRDSPSSRHVGSHVFLLRVPPRDGGGR